MGKEEKGKEEFANRRGKKGRAGGPMNDVAGISKPPRQKGKGQ